MFRPGDIIQASVSDADGAIWRKPNASKTGYEVVPLTLITLTKVSPEIYVQLGKETEYVKAEEPSAAAAVATVAQPANAVAAAAPTPVGPGGDVAVASGGVTVIVPSANVVARGQQQQQQQGAGKQKAPAAQRRETGRLVPTGWPKFESRGVPEIDENHNPFLPETERMHACRDKDAHALVPLSVLRANPRAMNTNSSQYFWIAHNYQTRYPAESGVTVQRQKVENTKEFVVTKDIENSDEKESTAKVTLRATIAQWMGTPFDPTDPQRRRMNPNATVHHIKFINPPVNERNKGAKDLWLSFGITNEECYGMIVFANQDTIPLHVGAFARATRAQSTVFVF